VKSQTPGRRDEVPDLKTEAVTTYLLVRAVTHPKGRW